jgi:hypothetical protein
MNVLKQSENEEAVRKRTTRKGVEAVKGNKITVDYVARNLGEFKIRTMRHQKKMIKFTKRKKIRIKSKEFRKRYGSV